MLSGSPLKAHIGSMNDYINHDDNSLMSKEIAADINNAKEWVSKVNVRYS